MEKKIIWRMEYRQPNSEVAWMRDWTEWNSSERKVDPATLNQAWFKSLTSKGFEFRNVKYELTLLESESLFQGDNH